MSKRKSSLGLLLSRFSVRTRSTCAQPATRSRPLVSCRACQAVRQQEGQQPTATPPHPTRHTHTAPPTHPVPILVAQHLVEHGSAHGQRGQAVVGGDDGHLVLRILQPRQQDGEAEGAWRGAGHRRQEAPRDGSQHQEAAACGTPAGRSCRLTSPLCW